MKRVTHKTVPAYVRSALRGGLQAAEEPAAAAATASTSAIGPGGKRLPVMTPLKRDRTDMEEWAAPDQDWEETQASSRGGAGAGARTGVAKALKLGEVGAGGSGAGEGAQASVNGGAAPVREGRRAAPAQPLSHCRGIP